MSDNNTEKERAVGAKVCSRCQRDLPASRFSRHRGGLFSICKDCVSARVRANGTERNERYRRHKAEYHRERGRTEKEREKARRNGILYAKRYPEKTAARVAVARALRSGVLIRAKFCSNCGQADQRLADGRPAIQAHHHRGYAYPLDVVWLCVPCHADVHREEEASRLRRAAAAGNGEG